MVKFLVSCALVEDKAAQVYQSLRDAALATGDEELGGLWQRMAREEESHALQLRLAARLSREHVFELLPPGDKTDPAVLLELAEALLERARSEQLDELGMLQIGDELETGFHSIHTAYTLLFGDPGLKKMFDALARDDNQHLAALRERIGKLPGAGRHH